MCENVKTVSKIKSKESCPRLLLSVTPLKERVQQYKNETSKYLNGE